MLRKSRRRRLNKKSRSFGLAVKGSAQEGLAPSSPRQRVHLFCGHKSTLSSSTPDVTRMRPLLQHASRLLSANTVSITPPRANNLAFKELRKVSNTPSICWSCQFRASSAFVSRAPKEQLGFDRTPTQPPRRQFSSSKIAFEEKRPSESTEARPEPALPREESANPSTTSPDTPPKAQSSKIEDTIARVPAEDLPSHKEGQRWGLSKRFSEFMDELLPKLAVVTHKVNIYTGTDYSGIEALRREIKEQGTHCHSPYETLGC